ncbi:hypothetical protein J3R30DRAFT_3311197 [Lentinula aciculospora]|uniref:C2H2-type domain-containing protein n=1 Tax=Lentinula aciculospora TaxID=153920 RepID=A0A9W9DEI7_9AGAR|nr:hypothetical protein J3R30DRAFT_3311197 [Lentinula aciculospora]
MEKYPRARWQSESSHEINRRGINSGFLPQDSVTVPAPSRIGSSDHDRLDEENECSIQTKKHVCHECSKRFSRPSSLRIHANTHSGVTPFLCPYPDCGRRFNVSSNMRRHYRKHDFQYTGNEFKNYGRPPYIDLRLDRDCKCATEPLRWAT